MSKGGARNRSGPAPDPNSERSERRGYTLTALPAEGYKGEAPAWPISPGASDVEADYWARIWLTPQACAWSMPSERWRVPMVARWVRMAVRLDQPDAPATLLAPFLRLSDQVGMTTAGLAEMGWAVATDEVGEKRGAAPAASSSRDRMKVVRAGGA